MRRRTEGDPKATRKRAISTFSTSPFCAGIFRVDGREVSVYQSWERTKGRDEGEEGRAKSGRLKKRILIELEWWSPNPSGETISERDFLCIAARSRVLEIVYPCGAGDLNPLHESSCDSSRRFLASKHGLRLDSREALLQGGDSGEAAVPGKADASLLLKAVRQVDKDLAMPSAKAGPKLPDAVIADLAAWVDAGAAWTLGGAPVAVVEKEKFDLAARKQRLPLKEARVRAVGGRPDLVAFLTDAPADDGEAAARHIPKSPKNSVAWVLSIRI